MKELWIDGHFIEVTDEVYAAYVKGQRKIDYFEKDLKTERVIKEKDGSIKEIVPSREDSLNRLIDDNSMQFSYDSKSVECEVEINVDLEKLQEVCGEDTAGLMLTNPNTVGLFDKNILKITEIVHNCGGLCYYDGANLNAVIKPLK